MVAWTISKSKYTQQSLKNVEYNVLDRYELKLRNNTNSPLPENHHPEQDSTPECDILLDGSEAW